jgi:hypothetical protein
VASIQEQLVPSRHDLKSSIVPSLSVVQYTVGTRPGQMQCGFCAAHVLVCPKIQENRQTWRGCPTSCC